MIVRNEKFILKNGLRVLWIPQTSKETAALGFAINVGPYLESLREGGLSHIIEHLVSRSRIGRRNLREQIHEKGGVFDAATSISQTYYHLYSFYSDFLDLAGTLIKGIFLPDFKKKNLEESKESVFSEMAYSREIVDYELLRKIMWKDERLTKPLMGSKESVMETDLESVRSYHRRYYCANNSSVVVIVNKLPRELEQMLESVPDFQDYRIAEIDPSVREPWYHVFQNGNLNTTVTLGFPTLGYKNFQEERHTFNLATTYIKSMFNSYLGKAGFIYEADWTWNVFPDTGDFVIVFEDILSEHLLEVLESCINVVNLWFRLNISNKEFLSIKKHRILKLKIGESLTDALPLFTKNFSSSEAGHSYEEATEVYQKATLEDTRKSLEKVLLSRKPYIVVNLGLNSTKYSGKINQILKDYYKEG